MRVLGEVLRLSTRYLEGKGVPGPRLDAELLLGHALELDRLQLYLQYDRPLIPSELARARELLRRRANREPIAWITGRKEFFSLSFRVDPGLLVPRPETECLVESLLECISGGESTDPVYLVDVGCGTGCVGLALAHRLANIRLFATDLDARALQCTRTNAISLGIKDRVALLQGDLLSPVPSRRRIDWVVSNPPYIPSARISVLEPEVSLYEPRLALDGGMDGLELVRRLVLQAAQRVRYGVAFEIGCDQADEALAIARQAGFEETRLHLDLAGNPRVVTAVHASG